MTRSEQRCRRHSWMTSGVGEWQPLTAWKLSEDSWLVYKPCRWDGRRLVAVAGRYMTYGGGTLYNADGTKPRRTPRGYVDVGISS